jgi:hypothetical protein
VRTDDLAVGEATETALIIIPATSQYSPKATQIGKTGGVRPEWQSPTAGTPTDLQQA